MQELIKYTDTTHVDYNNLNQGLSAIKEINTYINSRKKDTDSRAKLISLQKDIKNSPDLVAAHRFFIKEGFLQVTCVYAYVGMRMVRVI